MRSRGLWFSLSIPIAGLLYILWPGLARGETPLLRDLFFFFHPWTDYLVRHLRAGEFPLWNPLEFCGLSWAGHIQGRLHDPSFPLYLIAPYRLGVLLDLLLHATTGALFAVLLLRRLGVRVAGLALGASVFILNAWVIAKFEAPGKVGIFSFYPLALLAGVWASEGLWRRATVGMAFAVGLQILSGYPPIAAYVIPAEILAAGIIVMGSSRSGPRQAARGLVPLAVGFALGLLLSGVAWVPFLDEVRRAAYWRPMPFDAAAARSLHPIYLIGLVLPRFAGMPGADRNWGGELEDFGASALYVGLPALVCASFALLCALAAIHSGSRGGGGAEPPGASNRAARARAATTGALALFLALAIFVGLGRHGFLFALLRKLPIYEKTRWPSQSLGLVTASLGLLAGLGLDSLQTSASARRHRWSAAGAMAVIGSLVLLWSLVPEPGRSLRAAAERLAGPHQVDALHSLAASYFRGDLRRAGALTLLAAAIFALPARLWILLPALITADLALFGRSLVPFAPGDLFSERIHLGALDALRRGEERIFHLPGGRGFGSLISGSREAQVFREGHRVLSGATNLLDDLPAADGANPLQSARSAYLVGALARSRTPDDIRARLGANLGVSVFVEPSRLDGATPTGVQALPDTVPFNMNPVPAVPFARLVEHMTVHPQDDDQIRWIADAGRDALHEAVVSEPIAGFALDSPGTHAAGCTVTRPRAERIEVHVELERDALLVLRESHDPGWRASVDGRDRPIVRADYLFMGIPLHAGEREVVLLFDPRSVWVGRALTGLAILALLGLTLVTKGARETRIDASP